MTGVTYNALPPVDHPGKAYGVPPHAYGHHRPHFESVPSSMMAVKPPSYPAPAPAKEAPVPTTEQAQKKPTGRPQLRIPSSINNSKGNLAEFAAQVSIEHQTRCTGRRLTFLFT